MSTTLFVEYKTFLVSRPVWILYYKNLPSGLPGPPCRDSSRITHCLASAILWNYKRLHDLPQSCIFHASKTRILWITLLVSQSISSWSLVLLDYSCIRFCTVELCNCFGGVWKAFSLGFPSSDEFGPMESLVGEVWASGHLSWSPMKHRWFLFGGADLLNNNNYVLGTTLSALSSWNFLCQIN